MKKELIINILVAFVVASISIAGTWYFIDQNQDCPAVQSELSSETKTTTYTNSDYSFTLQFPDSWEGYEVVKGSPSVMGETAVYDVYLPTTDQLFSEGKIKVFSLGVFTEKQWADNQKADGPRYEVVGVSDEYTIGWFPGSESSKDVEVKSSLIHPVTDSFEALN